MELTTQQVWTDFADELRGFIFKRVKSADHTDDILQEAFLRIHLNLDKLKKEENIRPWTFRIVRNLLNDHFKAQGQISQFNDKEVADNQEFEDELSSCIFPMIAALDEKYRIPLTLSDIDGIKQEEVARKLGLTISATKSRIQRAREKLKESFLACCHFQFDKSGKLRGEDCVPQHCSICNEKSAEKEDAPTN
ncbi:MAG: RNA polymerase sigma-70 factor (ECF subfamily) [Flavobacteriales bacterium]|jgi:RNA polymerase sigma-70 factor (ECF subfamily)